MRGRVISENACALILCIIKKIDTETALKKCGVEVPCIHSTILQDNQKEIIKDYYYKENMSLTSIANIYNVTRFTIKNFLVKMDIPIKPRGRYCNETAIYQQSCKTIRK